MYEYFPDPSDADATQCRDSFSESMDALLLLQIPHSHFAGLLETFFSMLPDLGYADFASRFSGCNATYTSTTFVTEVIFAMSEVRPPVLLCLNN